MKQQWLVTVVLLIALGLLGTWIARNTYWDEVTMPRMLRGEASRNPFYGVQRLAEALGADTEWRHSLGEMPNTRSILMLTHWHWDLIEARQRDIERWVESGGRLLLDGNLSSGADALHAWSGLRIDYTWRSNSQDREDTQVPPIPYGRTEACRELDLATGHSQSRPERVRYEVCGLSFMGRITAQSQPAWAIEDDEGMQAVRVGVGRGSVTLVNGAPFGTRKVLEAENGALFVDAILLRRGDHIVFVSEADHPSLLELIWIYGAPAVLIALAFVALALWRNSVRFGPLEASPERSRRSLAEQIRGTGQFILRVDGGRALHDAMVRALHEAARLRIPSYETLQHDERLTELARVSGFGHATLADAIHCAGRPTRHALKHALAVLDTARAKVLAYDAARAPHERAVAHADSS